jgi:hypothetical protein
MTIAILRKELQGYIAKMPEYSLYALKPLLSVLANPPYVVETDLTAEEKGIIAAGRKELKEHPEHFVALDTVKEWHRNPSAIPVDI